MKEKPAIPVRLRKSLISSAAGHGQTQSGLLSNSDRNGFQTLLAGVSANIVNLPTREFVGQDERALQRVLAGKARRRLVRLGILLFTWAALCASAASAPKRVLLLFHEAAHEPSTITLEQAVRGQLTNSVGDGIEIYTEYLDVGRFAGESHYRLFREYLREKYRDRPPDVVYTTAATSFAGVRPNELMPGIPLVFNSICTWPMPLASVGTNMTGFVARFDYRGTLDLVFKLRPDTRRIVVICNFSASEQSFLKQVEKVSQSYSQRAAFEFWTHQPMTELQAAVSRLPAGTVVLTPGLGRDVSGRTFFHEEALELLLEHSSVPVFVFADSQVGSGAVGGSVVDYNRLGVSAGQSLRRILDGVPVSTLPITAVTNGTPMFDWRALRRWGISEDRLPPGSVLKFHEPTFWEQYRWWIVGVVVFCCLQTVLIVGLFVNRARRRDEQRAATLIADLSSRFINLSADLVDPEIEAAQRRVCEAEGLDVSSLWQWRPDNPGMHTLTHYYRPLGGPPVPKTMNAQEFFPWCERRVLDGEVVMISSLADFPAEASRDREVFSYYGLKTTLTFPLSAGGEPVFGSLNFNDMRKKRLWPEALVQRLQLVAQIFANALARKAADQALRESEARLSLAADAAGAGLWILYLQTNRFWITQKARELFHFPAEDEMTVDRLLGFVHPEDEELIRQALQTVVQTKGESQVEYRTIWPDGSVHWMLSRGRVRCLASGEPDTLMGVSVDITQRRHAELEAQELRSNLQHLARVNTLGALSGSLAHELNQPLGIILCNAQAAQDLLAQEPPDLAEVQDILADIVAADQRAGEVIERLRGLLKHGQVLLQPLELNQVIKSILQILHSDLNARGISSVLELAPDLPLISADQVQLQQLMMNLILNAVEAMAGNAPGTRRLHIQTRLREDGVYVCVRDEGSGLPQDLEGIFHPFFTTKSQGLGMGLAICRSIIEAHHGRLWAEPHPERGAVFRFELPIASSPDQP